MQLDVDVHVSTNYRLVAARLRQAAGGELQREMQRAIAKEAEPAQAAVKSAVPDYMPKRGGYAAEFAAALQLRTSRRGGGVRITAEAAGKTMKRDVGAREKGSLRHPVYGRVKVSHRQKRIIERPWVGQAVPPHFFTEPIREHVDEIQQAIHDAVQRVADKIGG